MLPFATYSQHIESPLPPSIQIPLPRKFNYLRRPIRLPLQNHLKCPILPILIQRLLRLPLRTQIPTPNLEILILHPPRMHELPIQSPDITPFFSHLIHTRTRLRRPHDLHSPRINRRDPVNLSPTLLHALTITRTAAPSPPSHHIKPYRYALYQRLQTPSPSPTLLAHTYVLSNEVSFDLSRSISRRSNDAAFSPYPTWMSIDAFLPATIFSLPF